tara:strand:- start:114 stop:419 length:306 start_codon:yes stop_codon:yes gene_type:complete
LFTKIRRSFRSHCKWHIKDFDFKRWLRIKGCREFYTQLGYLIIGIHRRGAKKSSKIFGQRHGVNFTQKKIDLISGIRYLGRVYFKKSLGELWIFGCVCSLF